MTIIDAIKKTVSKQNLTAAEAETVLEQIMTGQCSDAQIAALLTALRMKGETVDELTGFAKVMRGKAAAVQPDRRASAAIGGTERESLIDTCGTGGDVSGTFNVSTATAFVAAGAGVRVAKHGNRSISSQCGSMDVVEALGVKVDLPAERIAECIDQVGIGFLPAPLLHDAMKYVALARRQMGIRTIFNMLGPITNPANAEAQLIGVYAADLTETLAEVLSRLGTRRAIVVHGSDGMDEITITGDTRVTELKDGQIINYTLRPEDLGVTPATLAEIQGGNATENAAHIRNVLSGQPGARRDIVLLNAAAAIAVSNRASTLEQGMKMSKESIDNGNALAKLDRLIEFTNA